MKYGKYEFERTYLLDQDCLKNMPPGTCKYIHDKYIAGTRLRLRKVLKDDITTYKLTQKEELIPPQRGILKINTLYLSKEEYDKMNLLEGVEIYKERHVYQIDQTTIGIDKISLAGENIFMAEVEFETEAKMHAFRMPLPNLMEVTAKPTYSGYQMAQLYARHKI